MFSVVYLVQDQWGKDSRLGGYRGVFTHQTRDIDLCIRKARERAYFLNHNYKLTIVGFEIYSSSDIYNKADCVRPFVSIRD